MDFHEIRFGRYTISSYCNKALLLYIQSLIRTWHCQIRATGHGNTIAHGSVRMRDFVFGQDVIVCNDSNDLNAECARNEAKGASLRFQCTPESTPAQSWFMTPISTATVIWIIHRSLWQNYKVKERNDTHNKAVRELLSVYRKMINFITQYTALCTLLLLLYQWKTCSFVLREEQRLTVRFQLSVMLRKKL